MAILVLVVFAWQAIRIPLAGSVPESLAHARDWLAAERSLGIAIEPTFIRFVHAHGYLNHLARLFYSNLDETVVFGFFAIVRLLAPLRYPKLRSAFILAHIPGLAVLGAYPLAPPHWLASMPYADGPPAQTAALRDQTAAAVSMHFGVPVLMAAVALWLRPRAPLTWLIVIYPGLVFFVILATGNHYVFDTLVGTGCVLFGATVAQLLHGSTPEDGQAAPRRTIAVACLGMALAAFVLNGLLTGELT
jgi:PAP2 superfamily